MAFCSGLPGLTHSPQQIVHLGLDSRSPSSADLRPLIRSLNSGLSACELMSGQAGVGGRRLGLPDHVYRLPPVEPIELQPFLEVPMLSTDGNWSTTGIISFCPAGPEMCVIKFSAASGALVTLGIVRQPPHVLAADRTLPLGSICTSDLNVCRR